MDIGAIITKVILGGAGKVVTDSVSRVLGLFLTDKMVAQILVGLAEALVKKTKNTIDDRAVELWKRQLQESGIDIK